MLTPLPFYSFTFKQIRPVVSRFLVSWIIHGSTRISLPGSSKWTITCGCLHQAVNQNKRSEQLLQRHKEILPQGTQHGRMITSMTPWMQKTMIHRMKTYNNQAEERVFHVFVSWVQDQYDYVIVIAVVDFFVVLDWGFKNFRKIGVSVSLDVLRGRNSFYFPVL